MPHTSPATYAVLHFPPHCRNFFLLRQAVEDELDEEEEGEDRSRGAASGAGAEDEGPLWADETATVLLGLVSTSHERYLDKPLLDRCEMCWRFLEQGIGARTARGVPVGN